MAAMTTPTIPASHIDLVTGHPSVVVATVNADGTPQVTAVWSVLGDDGSIRVSFPTAGQKYRNLTRSPVATLFYVDPANAYRTLEIRADVQLAPDDDDRTGTKQVISSYGVDPATFAETVAKERVIATFVPRRIVTLG
jgi:PPOX class probable F420-dependent enzyme